MENDILSAVANGLYIFTDDAFLIDGHILEGAQLISPASISQGKVSISRTSVDRVLFGIKIPYLPILIPSTDFNSQSSKALIEEILSNQSSLLSGIGKWLGCTFSLRYIFEPNSQKIDVVIIGKVTNNKGEARKIAIQVIEDIANQLQIRNYPYEIINQDNLFSFISPKENFQFIELWQHLHQATLYFQRSFGEIDEQNAVVFYPFARRLSNWNSLVDLISTQKSPVCINITVQPTVLLNFERQMLSTLASLAATAVKKEITRNTYRQEITDLNAEKIAEIYQDHFHRLTNSNNILLMTVQVGSTNSTTAYSIADALRVELSGTPEQNGAADKTTRSPTGCDIVAPQSNEDQQAEWATIQKVDICPISASYTEQLGRTRYLFDIPTASAAFRFPISSDLGLPGIQTKPIAKSRRSQNGEENNFFLGMTLDGSQQIFLSSKNIKNHVLIAGTTQSGKTTTCFQLISELWAKSIPFLVIEPTNKNYRRLLGCSDENLVDALQVFTLGTEANIPFRINPFQLIPGVKVESHVAWLSVVFNSSLPQFGVLPILIQNALNNIYFNYGWQLTDICLENDDRTFPTMGDLYYEIIRVTEEKNWTLETTRDMVGAAATRIGKFLSGSLGLMLNTQYSYDLDQIMKNPTVLEIDVKGEERAFIMMLLLLFIREYVDTSRTREKLEHVTIIEEAHLLMEATDHQTNVEVASDALASSSKFFSDFLSEVSVYGEGVIVIEQDPSRIISDAISNTNTKLVHRLQDRKKADLLGGSINASEEQIKTLLELQDGCLALHTSSSVNPQFIKVQHYSQIRGVPSRVKDSDLLDKRAKFLSNVSASKFPLQGCQFCNKVCEYRISVMDCAFQLEVSKDFQRFADVYNYEGPEMAKWLDFVNYASMALRKRKLHRNLDAIYCFFIHLSNFQVTEQDKTRIQSAFLLSNGGSQ